MLRLGPALVLVGACATCTFEGGTDYEGGDLTPSCSICADATACCKACSSTEGCRFFTFMPSSKTCCLKQSDSGRRSPFADYVSGSPHEGCHCAMAPPAPPPTPPPPEPCVNDEGCSLNGVCDVATATCKCNRGWTNSDCSWLALGQTQTTSCGRGCAYHGYDGTKTTSWGGSVLQGEDGKYYMMVAEMSKHCSLGQWQTNSQIAAVVADAPMGPYEKYDTPVKPWSHNPQWVRAKDGTYLIFTLGDGVPGPHGTEQDCESLDAMDVREPHAAFDGKAAHFVIHYSNSVNGPWQNISIEFDLPDGDNMDNWNPAPVVMSDGSIRLMVHTDPAPWAGQLIVEAQDWRGPYVRLTDDIPSLSIPKTNEDQFMWQDPNGHWHILVHKMFDPAGQSPVPSPGWVGGHAFSRDGLKWSNISRCYNTTVRMTDGTAWEAERRERPKLIFDSEGAPAYMSNGIITSDNGIYTLIVPIESGTVTAVV